MPGKKQIVFKEKFATAAIPGSLVRVRSSIFPSEPLAHVIFGRFSNTFCDYCCFSTESVRKIHGEKNRLPPETLQCCSECSFVHYCTPGCQQQALDMHREECEGLKSLTPNQRTKKRVDQARFIVRLIIKLELLGGKEEAYVLAPDKTVRFRDIPAHIDALLNTPNIMDTIPRLADCVRALLPTKLKSLVSKYEDILPYFAVLRSYFMPIVAVENLEIIGQGLFLSSCLLPRGCRPNAQFSNFGRTHFIQVLEDIPNFSYSQIQLNVLHCPLYPTEFRRAELRENFLFDCECRACKDVVRDQEMTSVKCASCPGPMPVTDKEILPCLTCKGTKSLGEVVQYHRIIKVTREVLYMCDVDAVEKEKIVVTLSKWRGVFGALELLLVAYNRFGVHEFNIWRLRVYKQVHRIAYEGRLFSEALKYSKMLLPGARKYFGEVGAIHPGMEGRRYFYRLQMPFSKTEQKSRLHCLFHESWHRGIVYGKFHPRAKNLRRQAKQLRLALDPHKFRQVHPFALLVTENNSRESEQNLARSPSESDPETGEQVEISEENYFADQSSSADSVGSSPGNSPARRRRDFAGPGIRDDRSEIFFFPSGVATQTSDDWEGGSNDVGEGSSDSGQIPDNVEDGSSNSGVIQVPNNVVEGSSNSSEMLSNVGERSNNFGELLPNVAKGTRNSGEVPNNGREGSSNSGEMLSSVGEGPSNSGDMLSNVGGGSSNYVETPSNSGEISTDVGENSRKSAEESPGATTSANNVGEGSSNYVETPSNSGEISDDVGDDSRKSREESLGVPTSSNNVGEGSSNSVERLNSPDKDSNSFSEGSSNSFETPCNADDISSTIEEDSRNAVESCNKTDEGLSNGKNTNEQSSNNDQGMADVDGGSNADNVSIERSG